MGRPRTFLGAGLAFLILGGWAFGFWYVSGWVFCARVGGILAGIGLILVLAGLFLRWQGWE